MPALALDIGTYSIKAVHAKPGEQPHVERVVAVKNAVGLALPNDEASVDKLSQNIDSILHENSLPRTDVRLALPETVVSTKVIQMPPLSDAELASAIGWQAEQHIPIPPEELSLEYHVLFRPGRKEQKQMRVLLVGVRKQVVERYVEVFNRVGIEPSILETQVLSIIRSLGVGPQDPATLIAHIGASSMDICIVDAGEVQFVVSHLSAGTMLTQTLERSIGLASEQAIEYKHAYGLDQAQLQGKIAAALKPGVDLLVNEMRKAIQFYVSQDASRKVERLVLSGGTAQMPGLVQYLTTELGIEVLVASPFATASGEIPTTINPSSFTTCAGLVMRTD